MIAWLIIAVLLILIGWYAAYRIGDALEFIPFICWALAIFIGIVIVISVPINAISINNFVQQSEYIQTHVPKDAIENAALTTKKIDLNDWLYNAQYSKRLFGVFSFYPDTVLALTPIQ